MFGKRTGFIAAAAVLLSRSVVLAQIPDAFSAGFDIKAIELKATFGTKDLKDGDTLTPADAAVLPNFALGGSSGISPKTKYIILMVDPDSPSRGDVAVPQVLHYLKTDFTVSEFTNLASPVTPALKYVGPDASVGTGPHRYIFLLYVQPEGFAVKGVPSETNRGGFNVSNWGEINGLKRAVAGIHFIATPPAGGAPSSSLAVGGKTVVAPPATTIGTSNGVVYTQIVLPPCSTTVAQGTPKSVQLVPIQTTNYTSAPPKSQPVMTHTSIPPAQTSVPAAPKIHTVIVGGPNLLKYTPESVVANVGDVVFFDFLEKNHTVTQSTFDNPCVFNPSGVKSGFRPNPQNIAGKETFNVTVSDEKPKWFYCAQAKHCQAGMVFAINPGAKFAEFVNKAKAGANATTTAAGSAATGNAIVTKTACTVCSGTATSTFVAPPPPVHITGTPAPTTLAPSGTIRPSTGIPVPSGNASSPSGTSAPVFPGAGSRVTFSTTALAGAFLAAWLLI
ncbi:PEBP-like protein [Choiromyces venosus 120613-1]|uniref:PEBP-like protein n=1 Tax=Choiromyces venosus 120613-1 TaxID=1336337 RepID=A0A3N4K3B1_9PEZI|nr:PEBP-like protein [Choiromyces venosus 120613-1]